MNIKLIGSPKVVMTNTESHHAYFAWPTIVRLQNGRICVGASGYRVEHICPFGKGVLAFSDDDGETYTKPVPVFDTVLDDRDVGLTVFGEKGLIATTFNNPLEFQRENMPQTQECIDHINSISPEAEADAKEAGADYVGLDEYIEKIKGGWTDVDVIITQPQIMGKIGALGRILGPRGLMPNPKSGTVTPDVAKAVQEVKQGKIDFKVDKAGIIHTSIGKVSFTPEQIRDNAKEFIQTLIKLKPTAAKGTYIKSIYLSSTMSPGIKVDSKSAEESN